MSKRILVTGGSGFVGRHLVDRLTQEESNDVIIVDDLSIGPSPSDWELYKTRYWGREKGYDRYEFDDGSGRSFRMLTTNVLTLLGGELGILPASGFPDLPEFDEVYHLSSIVGGRLLIDGNPLLVALDLAIDSYFFLWAAKSIPGRILYASSSAAYPTSMQTGDAVIPLEESMINLAAGISSPDMTYGWAKLTGEYLSQIAVNHHGLSVAIIRPFSGYGEDQDLSYPVPAIALRVASHEHPVKVWGTGLQGRDFVHIDDCISGLIGACRNISDASAVNLGSGKLTSFLDLARLMTRLEGIEQNVAGTHTGPVGVNTRFCNPSFAARCFGWTPEVSLEEGMKRVLDFAHYRINIGATKSHVGRMQLPHPTEERIPLRKAV
jgi:UDP-glucose 4-epimerase